GQFHETEYTNAFPYKQCHSYDPHELEVQGVHTKFQPCIGQSENRHYKKGNHAMQLVLHPLQAGFIPGKPLLHLRYCMYLIFCQYWFLDIITMSKLICNFQRFSHKIPGSSFLFDCNSKSHKHPGQSRVNPSEKQPEPHDNKDQKCKIVIR